MEQLFNSLEKLQETDSIFQRAESLRGQARYGESLRLFKKALQGYRKTNDQQGIYDCMLSLGDIYRMVGSFELAAKNYTGTIGFARTLKSPLKVADARVGLGLSYRAQGNWREALKLIRMAQRVYQKNHDSHGLAFTLWAEAGALRIKGDIPGALRTFRESGKLFKKMKDTQGAGYCLCGLGGSSRIVGRFQDSLQYYMDANRVFSSLRDTFGKAYSYCGMGNACRMMGDYKNAFSNFSKASGLYKKIGDKVSYAYTLWGLSTAYKMNGEYLKAREYLREAMRFFRRTKDPRGIIYCKLGYGEIALIQGNMATATKYIATAFQESERYHFAVEKCYAETLISILHMHKSHRSAVKGQSSITELSKKSGSTCYNRLGLKLKFHDLPLNIP